MDTGANIIQYLNNNSILDYLGLSRNDQEQKKREKKKKEEEARFIFSALSCEFSAQLCC